MQIPRRRRAALAALTVPVALAGLLVLAGPARAQQEKPLTWEHVYPGWLEEFIASVLDVAAREVGYAQQAIEDARGAPSPSEPEAEGDDETGAANDEIAEGEVVEGEVVEGEVEQEAAEQASALVDQGTWSNPEAAPQPAPAAAPGWPGDTGPEEAWPRIETPTLLGADLGVGLGPSVLVSTSVEPGELRGVTDVVDQPPAGAIGTTGTGGDPVGEFGQLGQPVDAGPVLGGLDTQVLDPRDRPWPDVQVPDIEVPDPGGRIELVG